MIGGGGDGEGVRGDRDGGGVMGRVLGVIVGR